LSPSKIRAAVSRLRRQIAELEAFDPNVQSRSDLKIDALEAAIDETLSETFGHDTPAYQRYRAARTLDTAPISLAGPIPMPEVIRGLVAGKERAIAPRAWLQILRPVQLGGQNGDKLIVKERARLERRILDGK